MSTQTIANIANITLALSFMVALIFGIVQARSAARDRRERLTLEVLRQFQTRDFAELLHFLSLYKFPKTAEELEKAPAKERVMLIEFAQQMESLGIAVAERMIKLDLVDKTLGSFVTSSWEKYKPAFMDVREKAPDPFLGEYFQWLAERIERRMRERPRVPFNEKR